MSKVILGYPSGSLTLLRAPATPPSGMTVLKLGHVHKCCKVALSERTEDAVLVNSNVTSSIAVDNQC